MAEDWFAVSADVEIALADVGFTAYLETSGMGAYPDFDPVRVGGDTLVPVTVIESTTRKRDAAGVLRTTRTLMMGSSVVPTKGQRVQVRGALERIIEVRPLAPGGVDLLFKVDLED